MFNFLNYLILLWSCVIYWMAFKGRFFIRSLIQPSLCWWFVNQSIGLLLPYWSVSSCMKCICLKMLQIWYFLVILPAFISVKFSLVYYFCVCVCFHSCLGMNEWLNEWMHGLMFYILFAALNALVSWCCSCSLICDWSQVHLRCLLKW